MTANALVQKRVPRHDTSCVPLNPEIVQRRCNNYSSSVVPCDVSWNEDFHCHESGCSKCEGKPRRKAGKRREADAVKVAIQHHSNVVWLCTSDLQPMLPILSTKASRMSRTESRPAVARMVPGFCFSRRQTDFYGPQETKISDSNMRRY